MSSDREQLPAVIVDGVRKEFRVPRERTHTLKERALQGFRRLGEDRFEALKGVSFAVQPGEFFGIVGRNGSGKSTLLKCLAGIYRIDDGAIYINGRLSTFIELGVGFNPDLAARDNVTLNAIMLGLSPKEARARFDRVIEFAELEEFVDLKLKNYSSGMSVRLAFSVMIQADSDVLLIDEVLAVGDASFQQKCFDVFQGLKDAGKTILFVTHDMGAVQRFCDRALLLERGEIKIIGEPDRVASNYVEFNFGREGGQVDESGGERYGNQAAQLVDAWFEDENGQRSTSLPVGRPISFKARVQFHEAMEHPAVAVLFENDRHHPLFATSTDTIRNGETGSYAAGESAIFTVTFDNAFTPGRFFATPWVVYRRGAELADRRPRMVTALSIGTHMSGGIVDLPHDVSLDHAGAEAPVG
jgi:ABC-type polysaccharide/polyol phosphate transport system ATPase subunit